MRIFLAAALLATTSLASPALAAPAKPAPVAQLVKAVKLPYEQFTLKNGLRVVVHTDRKAPVVGMAVWYGVGSKHEPLGKTGFAHLFEHLMFGGSENVPNFDDLLSNMGASGNNGTTDFDRTNYFQTVPTGALERMLYIESDRMGHLLGAVTQEKLDNQRGVVQNEKRQRDNQPYGLTFYEVLKGLYPDGHPYQHSIIGSMADLDAASLGDVKNWFRNNYGPNNAVLVMAGDIDAKAARPLVERWFGDIPRGPQVARPATPVPTLPAPVTKLMKDRVATTQVMRLWAIPGMKDKDATALYAAGAVLGGLASSRMDNVLVRDSQLAVSVVATAEQMEDAGIFYISMNVKPGVPRAEAEAKLDSVIADFLKTGPTRDELQRVTTRAASGTIAGLESVGGFGGKAVSLAQGTLFFNNPGQVKRDLDALAKVRPAAVTKAANKWLSRPVFSLIVEPGEREPYEEAKGAPPAAQTPLVETAPVARPPMPSVTDNSSLDFPAIERSRLTNGIEVYFARRATVPKVNVSVSFNAGYAADPKDALGTQSLMLNVMPEGTATRNSVQIAEESERLGASLSQSAGLDRTVFSLSALSPNLGASIDLLADIIRNPAFANGEVDRVRNQQLARISSELTTPAGLAGRVLPVVLWGKDHPYAIPASGTGDAAVVKSLTPDALRAFHRRWLRPDNARIFVSGNTSLSQIMPMLEATLGNWPSDRMARPAKNFSAPVPAPKPRIILIDRPGSPQSVILGGHVLNASGRDDLVALRAANEVFGVGLLSRINQDLRETKGWSYGVRSSVGSAEERISFSISAPVQANRTGDSLKALRQHLTDYLGSKGVTPEEASRTINSNVRELPGSFETAGDVLSGMSTIITLGRPDDYYETLAKKYESLTPQSLDATARGFIRPTDMVWVIVGDAKSVRPQLDGIGLPVEDMPAPRVDTAP